MKVLYIDHHDSFGHSLVAFFRSRGISVEIVSCDRVHLLEGNKWLGVILSPGPGHPDEYPFTKTFYRSLPKNLPVLGVCLGHQLICSAWGGQIKKIPGTPIHGRVEEVTLKKTKTIFSQLLSNQIQKNLYVFYNSLHCPKDDPIFNNTCALLGTSGLSSAIVNPNNTLHFGVQFHPESFASKAGEELLKIFARFLLEKETNWLAFTH